MNGDLPSVAYLHLDQHANALTLLLAPAVAGLGWTVLPFAQATVLTAAGFVLWRLVLSYFLSGAVLGPTLENFHDLTTYPLLGFLIRGDYSIGTGDWSCFPILLCCWLDKTGYLLFLIGLWCHCLNEKQNSKRHSQGSGKTYDCGTL